MGIDKIYMDARDATVKIVCSMGGHIVGKAYKFYDGNVTPVVLEKKDYVRKDVYEICPSFEDEKFLLRFPTLQDAKNLVKVYGDKNALPFFYSDNCHGDNFYYPDVQRMQQAIQFWLDSYDSKWFVRWTIVEKTTKKAIGSVTLRPF